MWQSLVAGRTGAGAQVRLLVANAGLQVEALKRVRIGGYRLHLGFRV